MNKRPHKIIYNYLQYIDKHVTGSKKGISLNDYKKIKKVSEIEIILLSKLISNQIRESIFLERTECTIKNNDEKPYRLSTEGYSFLSSYQESSRNKYGFYLSIVALIISIGLNFYFFNKGKKESQLNEFNELRQYFNLILIESSNNRTVIINNDVSEISNELTLNCFKDPRFLQIIGPDYIQAVRIYFRMLNKIKTGKEYKEKTLHSICILQQLTQYMIYASGVTMGPGLYSDSAILTDFNNSDLEKCRKQLRTTENMSPEDIKKLKNAYRKSLKLK